MQLFVNDLTVMDFSYLCPQRGMVGESWIVDVALDGELNEESMIQDFGKVKKNLKRLIDEYIDHKLLVPAEYQQVTIEHDEASAQVIVDFATQDERQLLLNCPAEAYAFIYAEQINMQSVSDYLREVIAIHLPENVENLHLMLRAEVITTPYYHYTHGLKKHDGNCQRIAHGHRSKILIYQNDKPCLESQQYWAERWQDIYIATEEDRIDVEQLQVADRVRHNEGYVAFAYESSQGYFELLMPQSDCEVIDTDTTVECLAQFVLAEQIKRIGPAQQKVMAFEGVGKGALIQE